MKFNLIRTLAVSDKRMKVHINAFIYMLTEDKVTEIFVMTDGFCKVIYRYESLSEPRQGIKHGYNQR